MAAKFKRKKTKAEPLPKLKINTGREGQQSLNANPISRAVLLKSWVSPVIRDLKRFRFLMTDERVSQSRCEAKASIDMYLENCIQRKSIDDKNILYIKTSEVMLLTNINDDSIESFEENEVKKLAYCQHI